MRSDRRLGLKFPMALTAMVVAVLGMTGYTLWLLRADAITSHFRISALLARSFESFITQSLNATVLAATHAVSRDDLASRVSPMQAGFELILRNAPHLRSLSLLDASDRIIASSNPANVGLTIATHDYFPLTQSEQKVLRIGLPWSGRDFAEGHILNQDVPTDGVSTFIAVTQLLEASPNRLTLLVALNSDYFLNHMLNQLDSEAGTVEVLRFDGVSLMATASGVMVGGKHRDVMDALRLDEREFGQFEHTLDHADPTLSAFRVSPLYPIVVIAHLRRDVALQTWMTEAKTMLGVVVPALVAISLLSVAFHRRRLLLKAQLAESERLQRINAACVFTNAREGITITSADGTILDVNDAFTHITGYGREEVMGKNPSILSSGRQDKAFYAAMWHDLNTKGHWSGEIWNRRKDDKVFAVKLTISAVSDSQGEVQQYVAIFSDITAIKTYQNELERIARYDALTNLPNRVLLADRLHQAMTQALRRQQWLGVVFIDLDGFKTINDTHGHDVGDQVLVTVSGRMRQVLRDGDTLARKGGDEFVAVLVDLDDTADAIPLLNRLLAAAAQPMAFGDLSLQVSASIGVCFYTPRGQVIGFL